MIANAAPPAACAGHCRAARRRELTALGALPQQSGNVDLLTQANLRLDGAVADDLAGYSVAAAGDVNGDGRDDVIVGAHWADNNSRADSGSAYVVFGTASTTTLDLASLGSSGFRIDGVAANDNAGFSVARAGDVNGDGRTDVLVGAYGADNNGRANSGSAYVVFGTASPGTVDLASLGSAGFRIDGAAASDNAGISVAGAGDVNGDGRPDVIVGARSADNNSRTNSGSAYISYGFGTPALGYGALSGTVGQAIAPHVPSGVARTGTPSFAVSPALPAGLVLDPFTGTISGTPTVALAVTIYTVTMTELAGSAGASFSLSVAAAPGAGPPAAAPSPADTQAPRISLRVPRTQRLARAIPRARSLRRGLPADGVCGRPLAGQGDLTRSARRELEPGDGGPRRGCGQVRAAVTIHLVARDAAGNRSVLNRRVRLAR